jgi:hypothetical protein
MSAKKGEEIFVTVSTDIPDQLLAVIQGSFAPHYIIQSIKTENDVKAWTLVPKDEEMSLETLEAMLHSFVSRAMSMVPRHESSEFNPRDYFEVTPKKDLHL